MVERREPKLYTVEEARTLAETLRPWLLEMRERRREIASETETLRQLTPEMRGNGHAPEVARREGHIADCIEAIGRRLSQIDELGIEVKDLETGLVDFYSMRDDEVVFLCWAVDEPTVAYWHELTTGYRGRQPLDP